MPFGVRRVDHALGDGDVLSKSVVAGVDHHRAVETAVDAVVAGLLVAVIQVDGENGIREDLVGAADQAFQHHLVGVRTRAFADLDDEGRLAVQVAPEQAHGLFQVVDIVCADGVFAIGMLQTVFWW
jgi:hypothetical protein